MKTPSAFTKRPLCRAVRRVVVGSMLVAASQAQALNWELENGVTIDLDTTVKYTAGWRMEDQDPELLTDINGDDGNRAFKDGAMINNRLSVNTEADVNFGDYGFFVRGRAYYDDVYHNETDHDSPTTFNAGSVASNQFTKETTDLHGDKLELLDAFVYGDIALGERTLNLRVGDQVDSWGESLFLQTGISSTQSPLDATAANVPGVELKEIFLPTGQIYGQLDISDSLAIEGFAQYEWAETRLNGAGSYYSTQDFIDEGGENILLPMGATIDRAADVDASDSGQWGLALRYLSEELNDTEFGLYYVNYHDKTPMLKTALAQGGTVDAPALGPTPCSVFPTGTAADALLGPDCSSYHLEYQEDIEMLGFSVGTVIGDTNVSAEVAFRQGQPVSVVTLNPAVSLLGINYVMANTLNTQLSISHVFGPSAVADNFTLLAEAGYNQVNGIESAQLVNDKSAWGYQAKAIFDYNQVAPGLDLKVPVSWKQGVNGNSSLAGSFVEGTDVVSVGADFSYLNNFGFGVSYTAYLGDADENSLADRDFVAVNASYRF